MTFYIRRGSIFKVTTPDALDLHETLPAKTYTVKQDPMSGEFFLEIVEGFEVNGKIYGDTLKQAERILNTFDKRPGSTGVMLSGEKGSGKTLLAKILSLTAMKQGMPTIVINAPWHGEGFNSFMQTIEQPTVVIFDEFEKVYDGEQQEQMLTLLDGVYPSKKLYILTCNDKYKVNSHMQNRPGRIFYRLDYTGLTADFIREYCADNLKDQSHTEAICRISVMFDEFNFDILKALVEEMNRYGETPQEAMRMLNAKPESNTRSTYNLTIAYDGKTIAEESLGDTSWRGNPLAHEIQIYHTPGGNYEEIMDADDRPDDAFECLRFNPTELVKVDPDTNEFTFLNKQGFKLTLTKHQEKMYSYYGEV